MNDERDDASDPRPVATGSPPLALITGASSGIGLELAMLLAADGYRLIVTARPSPRLDAAVARIRAAAVAANENAVEAFTGDFTDPKTIDRLVAFLAGRVPDVLINNAGFGTHGPFAESDPASQSDMVRLNIIALLELTRRLLPGMIARGRGRGRGRVMNVSSTASFQPGPYMATYYASKAFVTSFSRAIAHELRHDGVTVTALCPGPTTTDFQNRAGVADSPLFKNNTMTAAAVARIGFRAMMAGRPLVICGAKNRLLALAVKFAPVGLATRIAGRLNSER